MALQIKKGTTDFTTYVFLQDSSSTTGAGLTGLAYNTSGLTCYYVRDRAAAAALSLATQTVTGAHSDGGFVEVDSTNSPGLYRIDLSDAILASGVNKVVVFIHGAANLAPCVLQIELTDTDVHDGVRFGITALPNAAADAAGGLPVSDAGGLDMDTLLAHLDADVSSRSSHAAAAVVSALQSSTGWTSGGSASLADLLAAVLAAVGGRCTKSGDAYTYYDDDGTTPLFTLTVAAAERTVS